MTDKHLLKRKAFGSSKHLQTESMTGSCWNTRGYKYQKLGKYNLHIYKKAKNKPFLCCLINENIARDILTLLLNILNQPLNKVSEKRLLEHIKVLKEILCPLFGKGALCRSFLGKKQVPTQKDLTAKIIFAMLCLC